MDTISWDSVSWEDGGETMPAVCPACGDAAAKPVRLKVRSPWPPNPVQSLVVCNSCGTAAYPTLTQPPYEAVFDPLVACYLEQNAGIDSMARVLSSVEPSEVKRYLELGCGYGLLLDYARTVFGWQVRGFDPGFSAQEGRQTLGVDIAHSYLEKPEDAGEPHDLVFCSEVIEHVFDPISLLTLLRDVLTPGGTLMLTTPSAGAIHAGTRPGTLLSLLSPGYHFVLFSKEGMETILRRAGFANVRVVDQGHSLLAAASPGTLSVDFDRPYDRRLYRSYLETRIPTLDAKSPLGLGYRYRLLKELTHAGDYAAARGAADQVADALRLRWDHLDLSDLTALLARLKADPVPQGVEPYHATAPFNLCGILYCHGMLAWQLDGRRDLAALWFEASALAGERMRAALHVIGADDGETEELSWRARANIPHVLAWDAPDRAADGAAALGTIESPLLRERIPGDILEDAQRKIFVDLVNLGQYKAADRLAAAVEAALPESGAVLASTAFALGILTLNHRKAPRSAAAFFGRAHQACLELPDRATAPIVQALLWPSLFHQGQALVNAGKKDEAGKALRGLLKPEAGLPSVPLDLRARTELLVRTQRLPT